MQKSQRDKIAFIVDENALRRLDAILQTVNGLRSYDVTTKDGFTFGYENLEELLSLPNSKERSIVELRAHTQSKYDQPSLVVDLGNDTFSTLSYHIKAEHAEAVHLDDQVKDWVREVRAWYSSIATWGLLGEFALTFAVWLALVWVTVQIPAVREEYRDLNAQVAAIGFLVWLVAMVGAALLGRARKSLFPLATFAIGYGVKRRRSLEQWRQIIFVGILLAFIVGVASSILASYLTTS